MNPNSSSDPLSAQAIDIPLTVEVTDDHPPAVPFPRSMYSTNSCCNVYNDVDKDASEDSTILLPKRMYIKDRNGRYLTVRDGPVYATLTFRTGDPDLNCAFEAIAVGSTGRYRLRGNKGNDIQRYYNEWYSCDNGGTFTVITATGNFAYFKDYYSPARFISDELRNTGAPVAHDSINDSSKFEIVQAAIKNVIFDVNYDIPGGKVHDAAPLIALSTSVRNDSDGEVNQTLSYAYEKWKVGNWNNTAGVEIGVQSTFEAGVPFVTSAEFEISLSASYSHEWGGEVGEKETVTSSTMVAVPPKKKARATIIIRNAQIDVGFTYTQTILWSDGNSETEKKSGIYRNVDSWHVDVVLDNWEPIP